MSPLVGNANVMPRTNGTPNPTYLTSITVVLTLYPRALKRMRAYESLADVRPTVRNKPAGLVNTWYDVTTTPSPHQTPSPAHGYPYGQLTPHPTSQSYMGELASLPTPMQPRSIPMQVAEQFFPQQPYPPLDLPMTSPSMQDPSLSAPLAEPDDPFWISPIGPSPVHWESTASEIESVRTFFSSTSPPL